MAKNELLVLIHEGSRHQQKKLGRQLAVDHPQAEVRQLIYPIPSIPEKTAIAVIGGDGSVHAVANKMVKLEEPGPLIVFPGGSKNGFHKALQREGSVVNFEDIRHGETISPLPLHSGMINEHLFLHIAGVGKPLDSFSRINESLRIAKLPRDVRVYIAGLMAGLSVGQKQNSLPFIQGFAIGSHAGPFPLTTEQSLYSENITRIIIENMTRVEMIKKLILIAYWKRFLKKAPNSLAQFTHDKTFSIADLGQIAIVGIGGDTQMLAQHKDIFIQRNKNKLYPTAVIFSEKK